MVGQLLLVQLCRIKVPHLLAVAEDGDLVRHSEHFVQLMADEHDGQAFMLELLDHLQQIIHLLTGQRRGGLIHEQQLRILRQRATDGGQLTVGHGGFDHRGVQIQGYADAIDLLLGDAVHFLPIHQLLAGLADLIDGDIFRNRHMIEERKILINNLNTLVHGLGGRQTGIFVSIETDLTTITGVHARNGLDKGGFARAVFAREAVNLTFADLNTHIVESLYTDKRLTDMFGAQDDFRHVFPSICEILPDRSRAART